MWERIARVIVYYRQVGRSSMDVTRLSWTMWEKGGGRERGERGTRYSNLEAQNSS